MGKKERTRWELGCFDSFESPFLKELHKIRTQQARKTRGLSPNYLVRYIKSQTKILRETRGEKNE